MIIFALLKGAKGLEDRHPAYLYDCQNQCRRISWTGTLPTCRHCPGSWEEGSSLRFQGALLSCRPDRQAESNLVHQIGEVVHQVQGTVVNSSLQVTEEVAQGIDSPANGDNETHGVEGFLHVRVHLLSASRPCTTREYFKKDKAPASHACAESNERVHELCLACITKRQHGHSSNEQAEEHPLTEIGLHRRQDQVELNHLERDSDRPINVAVEYGRAVDLHPELAHVEVVDTCNQGDQGTDVHEVFQWDDTFMDSIRKKVVAATIEMEMIQKEMATVSLGSRNPCATISASRPFAAIADDGN